MSVNSYYYLFPQAPSSFPSEIPESFFFAHCPSQRVGFRLKFSSADGKRPSDMNPNFRLPYKRTSSLRLAYISVAQSQWPDYDCRPGTAAARIRGQGGSFEAQLPTRPHVYAGRDITVRYRHMPRTVRNNIQSEHSGSGHSRNRRSEPLRRQRTGKNRSRNDTAIFAGRHRSRTQTKSRCNAFEFGHSLGSRAALGTIERTLAACERRTVCGRLGN